MRQGKDIIVRGFRAMSGKTQSLSKLLANVSINIVFAKVVQNSSKPECMLIIGKEGI